MSTRDEKSPQRLDIRKYPNRRYYDATRSRHLTLEEIRSLIRDGCDIKATDSKTGADITGQVLTQIILEFETPKIDAFPVPLLLNVIRSSNQAVREFVERYFNQAVGAYLDYQKQFEEQLRRMQSVPGMFPPFGAWPQAGLNPFAQGVSGSAPGAEPRPAEPGGLREVLTDLQQQVTELKEQLKKTKKRRTRR